MNCESSKALLLVRHLLLEAMHLFLVASLFLVAMPGAPSSFLLLLVRHLLLEAMHLFLVASLFLVAMPTTSKALVTRSDALVPSSVLVPSSDARSP